MDHELCSTMYYYSPTSRILLHHVQPRAYKNNSAPYCTITILHVQLLFCKYKSTPKKSTVTPANTN